MSASALDTPMMRQFIKVKARYPDAVIFYRMGDFYEMFLDDAELVAPILDIALTSRDKGKVDAVPMCGVPVHAADAHIKRLAELGHRIAICEQVEDPKEAGGKRLVRREVVEVVTPGLVGDPEGLDARTIVAVAAIYYERGADQLGLAVLDASTSDFRATSVKGEALNLALEGPTSSIPSALLQELARISPRELLLPSDYIEAWTATLRDELDGVAITSIAESAFLQAEGSEEEGAVEWPGEFMGKTDPGSRAAVAVANYLVTNQPFAAANPPRLRRYEIADTVVLDASTRRHLELHQNSEDRGRAGTLLQELDDTCCALGARRVSQWLSYPLLSPSEIAGRQDAVELLVDRDRLRGRLREAMSRVRDLERLLAKATRPGAVPRDLGALRSSLQALPEVAKAIGEEAEGGSENVELLGGAPAEAVVLVAPEALPELTLLLERSLIDDPPTIPKGSRGAHETGYIREGYRSDLDSLRESATKGREWIAGLEAEERERSGISTLKVRFHPVHGYSLEVGKAHLAKVPEDYERKQTLASVERFTTERLREVESRVMGANERAAKLERAIFDSVRDTACEASEEIREAADRVATLDALASFAEVARRKRWVRPVVDEGEILEIKAGRHPVVESVLGRQGSDGFVPNDAKLDPAGQQILLLTGPNMSGKSTYLRQVALIVLMAQMGSFVPAESACVGVVDRVFTRVGASDRLARGESTFMVEMRETAEILRQASRRSLVILDEIGRGTSTFDGLSIAWAVAEYLHDTKGVEARTLFATHYHELVALADSKVRIHNAHFEVREWNEEVIFLRRLVEGGANRSYGIQVARLAGLPKPVVARARSILLDLERGELPGAQGRSSQGSQDGQLFLALQPERASMGESKNEAEGECLMALKALDPDAMTPIDALTWLAKSRAALVAADDEGEGA
ncbi:MAG: DNA mismatch repair protein MutS [bacterium]|nr:DNA mismatch repair protein MutS [Deltaproteobacteria bacterium]MCP4908985.1 DNA mismatch repair protein MutS [bacterium]